MFDVTTLWRAPEINPINRKARTIPLLNPVDVYGRVFFFSWFGFFVAFWSWYAFPPLLTLTIAKDIGATPTDIATSNIAALVAALFVRLAAGSLCDRFGARYTFAGVLLVGSIPTAAAGGITGPNGLTALRFFLGIVGAAFVPCQVWSTGFFDKNVVGTANALTAGFGNAGGGVTYFLMPAIFDSLIYSNGLSAHVAWRVAFLVPFVVIVVTAVAILVLCPDTPTGRWGDRHLHAEQNAAAHGALAQKSPSGASSPARSLSPLGRTLAEEKGEDVRTIVAGADPEAQADEQRTLGSTRGEVVRRLPFREVVAVVLSPSTLAVSVVYMALFGAELAINSILGAYYLHNFPALGQTGTGQWAAMFCLLSAVFRPVGGIVGDLVYVRTGNLWLQKAWIHFLVLAGGGFLLAIGLADPHDQSVMFGLIAGLIFFLEAGNGANFALVPHVHPYANGIVSGFVGAAGNLGGIIFAIIFRYNLTDPGPFDYAESIWIVGVITIGLNFAVAWISPVPKSQVE